MATLVRCNHHRPQAPARISFGYQPLTTVTNTSQYQSSALVTSNGYHRSLQPSPLTTVTNISHWQSWAEVTSNGYHCSFYPTSLTTAANTSHWQSLEMVTSSGYQCSLQPSAATSSRHHQWRPPAAATINDARLWLPAIGHGD